MLKTKMTKMTILIPQVDEAEKSATKSEAQPSQIAACLLEYLAANCVVCLFVCHLLRFTTEVPTNAKMMDFIQPASSLMEIHKNTFSILPLGCY